jgi:hypothetical protein
MKQFIYVLSLVSIFIITPIVGSSTKGLKYRLQLDRDTAELETLTIYNPVKRQCDNSPFLTSCNARIDPAKLYKQEIRWMALSRDLLKRWDGEFNYGDTVLLTSGDTEIDGLWIIRDTLNKRYKHRGDLLFDSRVRSLGKWNNVKIEKITRKPGYILVSSAEE